MDVTCFDLVPSRRGTESLKWDSTPCPYPLWVADMDFPTADVIRDAIAERAASGILGYSICPPDLGEVRVTCLRSAPISSPPSAG